MKMDTVGEALMLARRRSGLLQADLSGMLGVSKAFISKVERGRSPLPAKHLATLPEDIRRAVANAMLEAHETEGEEIRKWAY